MTTNGDSSADTTDSDQTEDKDTTTEEDSKSGTGSISKKAREKAQEDYLTTLSKGIANLFNSSSNSN